MFAGVSRVLNGDGALYRVRDAYRAVGVPVCLGRWLHRPPT